MRRIPRKETRTSGNHQASELGHYVAAPRALIFAGVFLLVFGTYGGWHFIRSLEPLTWKPAP